MAALLLRDFGILDRHGFTCDTCRFPKARGCGHPPTITYEEADGTFTDEEWTVPDNLSHAPAGWRWSELGDVIEAAGWAWPWCPRWFADRSSPRAQMTARAALRCASWRRKQALSEVLDDKPTPYLVRLIEMGDSLFNAASAIDMKHRRDTGGS